VTIHNAFIIEYREREGANRSGRVVLDYEV